MLFVAKGIAGGGVLQTDCSSDVACVNHFQILSVVCVHLNNTADTLSVILCGVVNGGTSRQAYRSTHGRSTAYRRTGP